MAISLSQDQINQLTCDEKVHHLVYMASGGFKVRKSYWYTLGIPVNVFYNLDEQLLAIKMLGQTKHPEALKYIDELAKEEEETETSCSGGPFPQMTTISVCHRHPRAEGALRSVLTTSCVFQYSSDGLNGGNQSYKHPRYWEALTVITEAIATLK